MAVPVPARRPSRDHRTPRRERVGVRGSTAASSGQWRRMTLVMPFLVDPVHAERRVDLGPEVDGEEPVALQAPRRHQDEDAERGVGEAEAGRRRLRRAGRRRCRPRRCCGRPRAGGVRSPRSRRDLLEAAHARAVQARRGSRCSAARRGGGSGRGRRPTGRRSRPSRSKRLQRAREVVQGDRAGVGDPEGVEGVVQPERAQLPRRPRRPGCRGTSRRPSSSPLGVVARSGSRRAAADASGRRWRSPRSASTARRGGRASSCGMPTRGVLVEQPDAEPGQPVARRAARSSWPSARCRSTSVPRIAGVHSTVWILAISAETISRAVW